MNKKYAIILSTIALLNTAGASQITTLEESGNMSDTTTITAEVKKLTVENLYNDSMNSYSKKIINDALNKITDAKKKQIIIDAAFALKTKTMTGFSVKMIIEKLNELDTSVISKLIAKVKPQIKDHFVGTKIVDLINKELGKNNKTPVASSSKDPVASSSNA